MKREELNINMQIDLNEKKLYIGEEDASGAEYDYKNINDLADKIKFYLVNYYSDVIKDK